MRRSLRHFLDRRTDLVLILAGDHLYRMDYGPFLDRHRQSGADITLSVCPVAAEFASSFGLVHCDEQGFVTRFAEKPKGDDLEAMRVHPAAPVAGDAIPGAPFLASMGIYVFNPEVLQTLLADHPDDHDFGRELIPRALESRRVAVHFFRGYWEDIGSIASFYRANIALATERKYRLYDPDFPLFTRPRYLSPTRIDAAQITTSLIAEGSIIGRARIEGSVVGVRSRIGDGVTLDGAMVMGNDSYESDVERLSCVRRDEPPLGIGDGTTVRRAILDKGVRIGRNVQIVNVHGVAEADGGNYYIRDGIVIVPKLAIVPDGSVI